MKMLEKISCLTKTTTERCWKLCFWHNPDGAVTLGEVSKFMARLHGMLYQCCILIITKIGQFSTELFNN